MRAVVAKEVGSPKEMPSNVLKACFEILRTFSKLTFWLEKGPFLEHNRGKLKLVKHCSRLVLNESAHGPLILEACWGGLPSHPGVNLTDIGNANYRVGAFCILLLLAKFEATRPETERRFKTPSQPIPFKDDFHKDTWIWFLGIAAKKKGLLNWLDRRLQIAVEERFLTADPGTAYNSGKRTGKVQFLQEKFPLGKLTIAYKPYASSKEAPLSLSDGKLIKFAREIERRWWPNSDIEKRYPEYFPIVEVKPSATDKAVILHESRNQSSNSALLQISAAPTSEAMVREFEKKAFTLFMEKEFEAYRKVSEPFFSYVGNSTNSANNPYVLERLSWNEAQRRLLWANCVWYAARVPDITKKFFKSIDRFTQAGLGNSSLSQYYESKNILNWSWSIFSHFSGQDSKATFGDVFDLPYIVPAECHDFLTILDSCLEHKDIGVSLGAFFALQIILIDFLELICFPFYCLESTYKPIFGTDAGRPGDFLSNVIFLRQEAFNNRHLVIKCCNTAQEIDDAMQIGKILLNAQTKYLQALHAQLLSLEDNSKPNTS